MADAIDTPNPDELGKQIKDLTAKLEATQKSIDDLAKERDNWREKFEDSKNSRDKAKEKEREEAKKRGEFETVVKDLEDKLKAAEEQSAKIATLEAAQKELEEIKTKRREELVARLPEDKREAAKAMDIPSLELAVSLLPANERVDVAGKKSGDPKHITDKDWRDMTGAERMEWAGKSGLVGIDLTNAIARRQQTGK